jgi:mRNA interferase MazF
MTYKVGDIVLVKFPFTNLQKSKKRPAIIIKDENEHNDIVCFQITSNHTQDNLLKINSDDLQNSNLTLESYIKYDKCFTLNSKIIDKKIATVTPTLMHRLKELFCKEIF